jgi:hypothetical protein
MSEEGPSKISRRSFMKTTALTTGGVAGAALAAEVVTPLAAKEKLVFDSNQSNLRAADQPKKNPPLDRNLEVDVAVIGGGYTGLSSAYHLKKLLPGKSVALFEARGVGHGASGRNGGMVVCQPIDEYMQIGDPKTHKLLRRDGECGRRDPRFDERARPGLWILEAGDAGDLYVSGALPEQEAVCGES